MFHRTSSVRRHRRVIDEEGNRLEGAPQWLAVLREPQPGPSVPLPVLAVQSARGSRTLGLRVPQAPKRAVRTTVAYVPQQQLADAFLEVDAAFDEAQARVRGLFGVSRKMLERDSQRLHQLIGPARRFTSARGDEARMVTAHVQNGTAELVGLAAQVREEIRRRAHAAAPAFDPLLADLDPNASQQDAEVAS
ncbi:MAG TPA: hypothetical protein VGG83_10645 [Trebonia sp.]